MSKKIELVNTMKEEITFEDFLKVDIRIGTIVEVNDFPKARKPAYQLKIDFGDLGVKKTSAQITDLYTKKNLLQCKRKQSMFFLPADSGQIPLFYPKIGHKYLDLYTVLAL